MLDPYSLTVKRWRKAIYLRIIEQKNIFAAERIIYTTSEELRLAKTALASLPAGVVVPLGGDAPSPDLDDKLASTFRERFPESKGRRQLLFLGRLHFKKGIDRILAVMPSVANAFPDAMLTIVGDGDKEFEASLRAEVVAKRLQRTVLITGRLDGAEKWGAYASAELFLLPSRQENFAITVAEAMHMGLPVMISNRVNTWPYVRDAGAGLVIEEEGIERELELGIVSLLKDDRMRRVMGERGQDYARKRLTWAKAARGILNCYSEVLACNLL
jgi:glycosyltransferase involved in cell wall biosynthesis